MNVKARSAIARRPCREHVRDGRRVGASWTPHINMEPPSTDAFSALTQSAGTVAGTQPGPFLRYALLVEA